MTRHHLHAALCALLLLAAAAAVAVATQSPRPRTRIARGHLAAGVGTRRRALSEVREKRARGERESDTERGRADAGDDRGERGHGDALDSEAVHGPSTEAVDARAWPRSYVGARQAAAARAAYTEAPARLSISDFRRGADDVQPSLSATWQQLGPSTPAVPGDVSFTGAAETNAGRVTALAVDPNCSIASTCRMWIAAAGGGIWRTDDALATQPVWQPVDQGLTTSAFGSLIVDPNDHSGNTLYAGSGEANGSGDSEAGVGLFRSTDGGDHWTLVPGSAAVATDRAIGAIQIAPDGTIWLGTDLARHGSAAVNGGRLTPPNAPALGLYKSSDAGASFQLAFSKPASTVNPAGGADWFQGGVNHLELDPNHPSIVYAAVTGYGIWRNSGDGVTPDSGFSQVFATMLPADYDGADTYGDRTEFALADAGASSRLYVGDSSADANGGKGEARVWRVDDVNQPSASLVDPGTPGPGGTRPSNIVPPWVALSSTSEGDPGFTSYRYCKEQCGYDDVVVADPSNPDTVMLGGDFDYDGFDVTSDGEAVLRSTDKGVTFSDVSSDAQDACDTFYAPVYGGCPAGMHPDTHAIAFVPDQTGVFFVGSDGGVSRSGLGTVPASPSFPGDSAGARYVDRSSECGPTDALGNPGRGLTGDDLTLCQNLLRRIPYRTDFLNAGLDTVQFQSVSVDPQDPTGDLLAGAQDNGTWALRPGGGFFESIGGDGGQSVIDPRVGDPGRPARVHTFFDASMDVNYGSSDPPGTLDDWAYDPAFGTSNPNTWLYISGPMDNSGEAFSFYAPLIDDPRAAGTLFTAGQHVWRTQDMGGARSFLDANCQDNNYAAQQPSKSCGDWVSLGTDLSGGDPQNYVVALERAPSDDGTLWAATRKGDLYRSSDADGPASGVTWTALSSARLPHRFVSGIVVDPGDPRHAWISYSGYDAYTPSTPGHVFDVRVDGTGNVTATDLSGTGADGIGDLPVTALVRDDTTGDLYAATDFGVLRLPSGALAWAKAAAGMPIVGVYGLTLAPGSRVLDAATHGRGLWTLTLPKPGGAQPPSGGTAPAGTATPATPATKATSGRKPRFRSARVQRLGRRVFARVVLRSAGGAVRVVVRDRLGRRVAGSAARTLRSGRAATIIVTLPARASSTLTVSLTAANAHGASTVRRAIRPPRRAGGGAGA